MVRLATTLSALGISPRGEPWLVLAQWVADDAEGNKDRRTKVELITVEEGIVKIKGHFELPEAPLSMAVVVHRGDASG